MKGVHLDLAIEFDSNRLVIRRAGCIDGPHVKTTMTVMNRRGATSVCSYIFILPKAVKCLVEGSL